MELNDLSRDVQLSGDLNLVIASPEAEKLTTPRDIAIGNATNTFDGTADLEYTLADIGAAEASHKHTDLETSIQNLVASLDTKADMTALENATKDMVDTTTLEKKLETKVELDYLSTELGKKVDTTTLTTALEAKADSSELDKKADKSALDAKADVSALETKANKTDIDTALADKVTTTTLTSALSSKADVSALESKADKTDLDTKANVSDLEAKADKEAVATSLASKVDKTDLDAALSLKADKTALDAKADADTVTTELAKKVDSDTLTTELDKKADKTALDGKADATHTHSDLETSIQTLTDSLGSKADSATLTEELAKKADVDGDITGNAGTASALEMARKITFKGDVVGSLDFDGSDDVEVEVRKPYANIGANDTNLYPYHRFGYVENLPSNRDISEIFTINGGEGNYGFGIFKVYIRTITTGSVVKVQWLSRSNDLPIDIIQVGFNNTIGATSLDLYCKTKKYNSMTIQRLHGSGRSKLGDMPSFSLIDAKEMYGTTETDKKDSYEVYTSIESASEELNRPTIEVILPTDVGVVSQVNPDNIYTKRMIYRGKSLGNSFTEAQKKAIQNGSFDDLYIGDYWYIGGKTYRIVDFNYYYGTGYDYESGNGRLLANHLVVQCDSMGNSVMNLTDTTEGGFLNTYMYLTKFPECREIVKEAFGDSLLEHYVLQTNVVSEGHPSGVVWEKTDIDLMTEEQVYGTNILRPRTPGTPFYGDQRIGKSQLALYLLQKEINPSFWLKDIVGEKNFIYNNNRGCVYSAKANSSDVVIRPIFCIG